MRILFATTAGTGHFGPLIPFVNAARAANAEILVAAPASFEQAVEGAGFPFRALGEPTMDEWGAAMAGVRGLSEEDGNKLVIGEVFGRLDAGRALPAMLSTLDDWQPDIVVRETFEFASLVAAEAREVPHVHVATGILAASSRALPAASPAIDELRASLGLAADPDLSAHRLAPTWSLSPLSFEDPADAGPPQTRRFRSPTVATARSKPPKGVEPTVYVTFGTVAPNMGFFPVLYRAILGALADLPVRVVVTVGRSADPADLGPLPANASAHRWIDQAEVLAQASVVVNHGGYGTVLGCLTDGVAQVVLPLFADQPINAARVGALGAGIAMPGGGTPDPGRALASVKDVAIAVRRVLDEPSYTLAAENVAAEIEALLPVDEAVASLVMALDGG
jgi:UDP:flavonoid glycosyltransferase YjiC (YdhE family)